MIKNGLAVGNELHRRKIKPGVFCPACGREETVLHRFWMCPHSKAFWTSLHMEMGIEVATPPAHVHQQQELARWLLEWFAQANSESRALMIKVNYALWLAR